MTPPFSAISPLTRDRMKKLIREFYFREMESLGDRLNEATGTTHAQIELNKKRESEVTKLRKDQEECRIQQDATCASLKKKQQDAVNEMSEQCEQLSKMKAK